MRAILAVVCLVFCAVPTASAKPTYVLFDTSTSMKEGKRLFAFDQAKAVIAKLDDDAELSIVEVGGGCALPNIPKPVAKSQIPAFAPAEPNGSTPLGITLKAVLESSRTTGADIYVYSDGGNFCGEVNVCEVTRAYLSVYPEIDLHFDPIDPNSDDTEALGCLKQARQPVKQVSIAIDPAPQVGEAKYPRVVVGWILLLSCVLVAASAAMFIHMWGGQSAALVAHHREDVRRKTLTDQQRKDEDDVAAKEKSDRPNVYSRPEIRKLDANERKHSIKWPELVLRTSWPLALVVAVDLALALYYEGSFGQAWTEFWSFAQSNFGSVFLTGAMLGFVGWALIRFWDIKMLRRDQISEASRIRMKADERAAARTARQRRYDTKVDELKKQNQLVAALSMDNYKAEVEQLKPNVKDEQFDAIVSKVTLVQQRIESLVQVSDNDSHLDTYLKQTNDRASLVAYAMMRHRVLAYDAYRGVDNVMRAWSTYRDANGEAVDAKKVILAFNADGIQHQS